MAAILSWPQCVNTVDEALAPGIAKSSAAMIMIMQKKILVLLSKRESQQHFSVKNHGKMWIYIFAS